MTRCGCQIAWDAFYEGEPRPMFIDYIGQGDLWIAPVMFQCNPKKRNSEYLCIRVLRM